MTNINSYILTIVILWIVIIVLIGVCVFLARMWYLTQKEIDNKHAPVYIPDVTWLPDLEEADDEYRTEI